MKPGPRGKTIILPQARDAAELAPSLTSLAGAEEARGATGPFRLLDSVDGSIRKSGRALIESAGRLLLVGGADGPLSQDITRRPGCVGDIPDGGLKAALGTVSPLRSLLPRAEGTASSRTLRILDEERKTVARLSFVTLRNAPHGATVATVEGLRGYDAAFDRIASDVANLDGLPAAASDLYSLLGAADAAPGAAVRGPVRPGTPALAVTTDIVRDCLAVARGREAGIVADLDTEFLHDYRVALRKLRSVVSLFRGVYTEAERHDLREATRALMARTGPRRDLDVQLLDRERYRAILPEEMHDGLDLLFARLARNRAREHRGLAQWLRSADYAAAMTALTGRLADPVTAAPGPAADHPVEELLRALIRHRWRTTVAAAGRIGPDSADEAVHDLRIRCKKLRYLIEFAAPVFGAADLKPLLRPLKELQEELGLFNDCAVQSAALRRLLPTGVPPRNTDLAIARSIGALTAVLHQRKAVQRLRVEARLAAFGSARLRRRATRWVAAGEA